MSAIPQHGPSILLREDRGGVCTLTMNRPLQMNLLTTEMLEALQKAFDSLMDDGSIRVSSWRRRARASAPGMISRSSARSTSCRGSRSCSTAAAA
jgi:Enoyl-CoA hydratase/carnithine racemase